MVPATFEKAHGQNKQIAQELYCKALHLRRLLAKSAKERSAKRGKRRRKGETQRRKKRGKQRGKDEAKE